jgi:hypothetical protein
MKNFSQIHTTKVSKNSPISFIGEKKQKKLGKQTLTCGIKLEGEVHNLLCMRILKVAQERRGQHEHIFLNCDI